MKSEKHLNQSKARRITFDGEDFFDFTDKGSSSRWWRIQAYIIDEGYNLGIGHITTRIQTERDCYWAFLRVRTKNGLIKRIRNNTPPETIPPPFPDGSIEINPYLDTLYKVYHKDGIPETLLRDWEKEREAYVNLVSEVERFINGEAPAPDLQRHQP